MESTSPSPLIVKREVNVTLKRTSSGALQEVFLELPCASCDVCGGYCSWQNPHLLPEEVWTFFFFPFPLHSHDQGPSHMGKQPELTGLLGCLVGFWCATLPDMASLAVAV